MLTIQEMDEEGVTRFWEMQQGVCPCCGATCSVDVPRQGEEPPRLICLSCSYSAGYDFSPAVPGEKARDQGRSKRRK